MKKNHILFILLLLLVGNSLFAEKDSYWLSDTSRELYDTGLRTVSDTYFIKGGLLNPVISPNLFTSYGLCSHTSQVKPLPGDWGNLVTQTNVLIAFLRPSVENPAAPFGYDMENLNLMLRFSADIYYPIKVVLPWDFMNFTLSPYIRGDYNQGLFSNIVNIPLQNNIALSLGGKAEAVYSFSKTLRAGGSFQSFIIGIDTGRPGYNKDYVKEIQPIHWGNFLDMEAGLFAELDLSRTETIRLIYSHSVLSWFNGDNVHTALGQHQFGLGYTAKLIR